MAVFGPGQVTNCCEAYHVRPGSAPVKPGPKRGWEARECPSHARRNVGSRRRQRPWRHGCSGGANCTSCDGWASPARTCKLVASLCNPNRVSLDIGADVGEFTIAMLPSSRSVIAFEPRPAQAREPAAMFDAVGAAVRVQTVALSDQPGVTTMRVVESDPGRSTIDTNARVQPRE